MINAGPHSLSNGIMWARSVLAMDILIPEEKMSLRVLKRTLYRSIKIDIL